MTVFKWNKAKSLNEMKQNPRFHWKLSLGSVAFEFYSMVNHWHFHENQHFSPLCYFLADRAYFFSFSCKVLSTIGSCFCFIWVLCLDKQVQKTDSWGCSIQLCLLSLTDILESPWCACGCVCLAAAIVQSIRIYLCTNIFHVFRHMTWNFHVEGKKWSRH